MSKSLEAIYAENTQSTDSSAVVTGKFLLPFPVLQISVLHVRIDQVVHPATELRAQVS